MDEAQQAYQYFENDPALVNLRKSPPPRGAATS